MVDSLTRLRHHIIISSHDDDGNIRHFGTTSTHGGERLMSRGIEEGDTTAVVQLHIVGTDVLGDTTSLTSDHVTLADIVQKAGLTMVHMTHHRNDRSTWLQVFLFVGLFHDGLGNLCTDILRLEAELLCHQVDGLSIQTLVNTNHNTHTHASTDDLSHRHIHHVGKLIGSHELSKFQNFAFCQLLIL